MTKNEKIITLSKCTLFNNKKLRFIKGQGTSGLLNHSKIQKFKETGDLR